MRGNSGKKISQKSRNSCSLNSRSCGCIGTVDSGPKCAHSHNQIQTLKSRFSCHIYCAHYCNWYSLLRSLHNPRQSYQAWLAVRQFHAAIRRQEQVKRTGRGCRAIFPRIDQGLALVLPLCSPLSLHPGPRFPVTHRGPSICDGAHLPCVWWNGL